RGAGKLNGRERAITRIRGEVCKWDGAADPQVGAPPRSGVTPTAADDDDRRNGVQASRRLDARRRGSADVRPERVSERLDHAARRRLGDDGDGRGGLV